jgi:hypothetical protein
VSERDTVDTDERERRAGVAPSDVDDIVAFVDRVDSGVVRLRWVEDGDRRTTFAFDVDPTPAAVAPLEAPTVDVRSVDDDPPVATPVPLAAIDSVRPIPDAETVTETLPTDPLRRAETIRGLAAHAPTLVDVSVVLRLIDSTADAAVRVDAVRCLSLLAAERPDDCVAAIPQVDSLLDDGVDRAVRAGALTCLGTLASVRPKEVAPYVERVFFALDVADDVPAKSAATCVSHVASADPEAVVDAADRLVALTAASDPDVRMHAAYAVGRIAVVAPGSIRSEVATLAGVLADETERTATRLNATCAVGRVAGAWPDAVVDELPRFVDALGDDDAGIRANAAGVVGDVASAHAVVVRRHVAPLLSCLDDADDVTRANGSTAVARVAREFPESVCDHVDRLVDALDDDSPLVRENVCWTLGYLRDEAEAEPACPELERLRTHDGDERVRDRAAWALGELGTGSGVGATD